MVVPLYILDAEGEPQPVTIDELTKAFSENKVVWTIGRTTVNDVDVYTTFLGADHQTHPGGLPLFFETMIFGGEWDQYQWRWSTRTEAVAGHNRIVADLREGRSPDDAPGGGR